MIAALAGQGYDVKRCCRILGVAPSGYFGWRGRAPSHAELRREWLRGLIGQIHANSPGVYGFFLPGRRTVGAVRESASWGAPALIRVDHRCG